MMRNCFREQWFGEWLRLSIATVGKPPPMERDAIEAAMADQDRADGVACPRCGGVGMATGICLYDVEKKRAAEVTP